MSDNYERGRHCAKAFVSSWNEFDKKSLVKVIHDTEARSRRRRTFRFTNQGKVRFVAGISSVFMSESSLKLTRSDYAQLAGINQAVFNRLLEEDPSLDELVKGTEEKKGDGPRKSGPPARYVSYALKDVEFRKLMKGNKRFRLGFWDQLHESWMNGELGVSSNLKAYARQQKRAFKSHELLRASRDYRTFLNDTRERIKDFCKRDKGIGQHSKYGSAPRDYYVFMRRLLEEKEKQIDGFLATLGRDTESAIKNVRRMKFEVRFAESVLKVDVPEIRAIWSDLMIVSAMTYFLSPWSADEFGDHTEFFRTSSECFEQLSE